MEGPVTRSTRRRARTRLRLAGLHLAARAALKGRRDSLSPIYVGVTSWPATLASDLGAVLSWSRRKYLSSAGDPDHGRAP